MSTELKIALIPGDGIGTEVMPEGVRALEAAGKKHGIDFQWQEFDWSCERYLETGSMMPEDGIDQLRPFRRDLSRRGRFPDGRGSRLAMGPADPDTP